MIPATLPVADPVEPAAPPRAPKGAPFAAVIDAVPADSVPDTKSGASDQGETAADPDATAPAPPGPPTVVADATALIAQLCPPPAAAAAVVPSDRTPTCHSRESGNPDPSVELDPGVRGNDMAEDGKAPVRAAKAPKQAGKAAVALPEAVAAAPKAGEASAPAAVPSGHAADAPVSLGMPAAAPPADVAVTRHLDLAHDAQWLDRLTQDIVRSADQSANLRFTLAPEHLGRLTVDLAASADGTAVRLTTESQQAHRIVSDAQPRLVAEARAQGLRISETHVDLDRREGGQPSQPSRDGGAGQDRARPAVTWTEMPRRRAGAVAAGVPAARDLYA